MNPRPCRKRPSAPACRGEAIVKGHGFTATVYGFGAGIFFIPYFQLETPSNLVLVRVGARRWIARIMFSWGVLSGLTAFV